MIKIVITKLEARFEVSVPKKDDKFPYSPIRDEDDLLNLLYLPISKRNFVKFQNA